MSSRRSYDHCLRVILVMGEAHIPSFAKEKISRPCHPFQSCAQFSTEPKVQAGYQRSGGVCPVRTSFEQTPPGAVIPPRNNVSHVTPAVASKQFSAGFSLNLSSATESVAEKTGVRL